MSLTPLFFDPLILDPLILDRLDIPSGEWTHLVSGLGFGNISDVVVLPNMQLLTTSRSGRLFLYDWEGDFLLANDGVNIGGGDSVAVYVPYSCLADLDQDGMVDVQDLLMLLGNWGLCPPTGIWPGDLNFDGTVDVVDLLELLGAWGPCE